MKPSTLTKSTYLRLKKEISYGGDDTSTSLKVILLLQSYLQTGWTWSRWLRKVKTHESRLRAPSILAVLMNMVAANVTFILHITSTSIFNSLCKCVHVPDDRSKCLQTPQIFYTPPLASSRSPRQHSCAPTLPAPPQLQTGAPSRGAR